MYLMIQNKGVAPVEAFTMLGDSGTRGCGVEGVIGQFGSGSKHGINMLLRKGIDFRVYSGHTRLEFYWDRKMVKDANGEVRETYPVKCKLSGDKTRTIDCGWTLDFGAMDWRETSMALREFVSNALDCTNILGEDAQIGLKVQTEDRPRACKNTTRIYVSLNDQDVADFYRDLGKHFLHFSANPEQAKEQFLRKNPESLGPRIYREGVFIRQLSATCPAAFDYNFKANKIEIDECRNSSEYSLRATIAQTVNRADPKTLKTLFKTMSMGDTYEASLDQFYLGYRGGEVEKNNWKEAWEQFAGSAVIATEAIGSSPIVGHVEAKGYKVIAMPDAFAKVAADMGVSTVSTVLGAAGASGKIETGTTAAAQEAVDTVWGWCEVAEMTGGKTKPEVKCFRQLMDGEGESLGYYQLGTHEVHIREDLAGKIALKTAIEEVAHYITGSTDCSRDFQNYAFDMIVELCL